MTDKPSALPVPSPGDLRDEFLDMLRLDWLGPAGGDDETLYEKTIRDRYLLGMLAPKHKAKAGDAQPDEEPETTNPEDEPGEELAIGGIDDEQGEASPPVPEVGDTAAFLPSSLGITVALAHDADFLIAEVSYGRYVRMTDENER